MFTGLWSGTYFGSWFGPTTSSSGSITLSVTGFIHSLSQIQGNSKHLHIPRVFIQSTTTAIVRPVLLLGSWGRSDSVSQITALPRLQHFVETQIQGYSILFGVLSTFIPLPDPDEEPTGTPILQGKPRPQAKRLGRGKILLLPTRHGVVIAYKSGNNQYRRLS